MGNLRMLNSDSDTNAVVASSVWPVATNVTNVAMITWQSHNATGSEKVLWEQLQSKHSQGGST